MAYAKNTSLPINADVRKTRKNAATRGVAKHIAPTGSDQSVTVSVNRKPARNAARVK